VRADPPTAAAGEGAASAGTWPYWRMHGTPRIYYSNYADEALHAIARELVSLPAAPLAPWVIFDNTAQGFAVANAALLQDMLRDATRSPGRRGPLPLHE